MNKNIVIIGSTGVLGSMLLNFLKAHNHPISLISCFSNYRKLLRQKISSNANEAVVLNENIINFDKNLKYGDLFLFRYIQENSINIFYLLNTGFDSLKYLDLIIKHQKDCTIAIANKEVLIAGGKVLIEKILRSGNFILPLDSEHFSLIHLLPDRKNISKYISKIYLTASGGPFYFDKKFNINKVNIKKATTHPIWKMGYKNTIDSSNLVNKILECFELSTLYNFPISNIDITISPKAFAHSIIVYKDQRISINCFNNDMMIPLASPFSQKYLFKKSKTNINSLVNNNLTFTTFNNKKFQILKYSKQLLTFTHIQQINFLILNAEAVNRFISNNIKYKDIIPFIFNNIDNFPKKILFKNLYEIIAYTNKMYDKVSKL